MWHTAKGKKTLQTRCFPFIDMRTVLQIEGRKTEQVMTEWKGSNEIIHENMCINCKKEKEKEGQKSIVNSYLFIFEKKVNSYF